MTGFLLDALILPAALGCGLIGGVFFAFSSFVMTALARLPAPQGFAAMQSINLVVINPVVPGRALRHGGILPSPRNRRAHPPRGSRAPPGSSPAARSTPQA